MPFIYLVTNTINNKVYVGKTRFDVVFRWKGHRVDAKRRVGFALHAAMRKYGEQNFQVSILATCPASKLNTMEKIWIFLLNSIAPNGYNLTSGGDGGEDIAPETRERRRKAAKAQWADPAMRKVIQSSLLHHKGKRKGEIRNFSEESRKRLSDSMRKRMASDEERKKISDRMKISSLGNQYA